jgi:hypothetical protein
MKKRVTASVFWYLKMIMMMEDKEKAGFSKRSLESDSDAAYASIDDEEEESSRSRMRSPGDLEQPA